MRLPADPENAALLLTDFKQACVEEGILGKRFVFGGTPPVVEEARKVSLFEALFSGEEPMEKERVEHTLAKL